MARQCLSESVAIVVGATVIVVFTIFIIITVTIVTIFACIIAISCAFLKTELLHDGINMIQRCELWRHHTVQQSTRDTQKSRARHAPRTNEICAVSG